MKIKTVIVAGFFGIVLIGCKQSNDQQSATADQATDSIFHRGKKITNNNFKGTAYLQMMVDADSTVSIRENGMRADLAQPLADLKPSFFRFPGGNNLE